MRLAEMAVSSQVERKWPTRMIFAHQPSLSHQLSSFAGWEREGRGLEQRQPTTSAYCEQWQWLSCKKKQHSNSVVCDCFPSQTSLCSNATFYFLPAQQSGQTRRSFHTFNF